MRPYDPEDVLPQWEPIPYDAKAKVARKQQAGFLQRASEPLVWTKINLKEFPAEGIFGHYRDWFEHHDIAYVATHGGEELVLIQRVWSGWPDPPEWGLASRPAGDMEARWEMWGSFPELPSDWTVPDANG